MAEDRDTAHTDEHAHALRQEATGAKEEGQSRPSSLAHDHDDTDDDPAGQEANERDQLGQHSASETGQEGPTVITVYVFDTVPPFTAWADRENRETDEPPHMAQMVESTLEPSLDNEHPFFEEDAIDDEDLPSWEHAPTTETPQHRRRPRTVGLLLALAGVALVALLLAALYVLPLLTATASITVLPVQTPITTTTTLAVVTAGTLSSQQQHQHISGRLLSALTLSGQRMVATTGVGTSGRRCRTWHRHVLQCGSVRANHPRGNPARRNRWRAGGHRTGRDPSGCGVTNRWTGNHCCPCRANRTNGQHPGRRHLRPLLPGGCARAKHRRLHWWTERPHLSDGDTNRH